MPLSYGNALYNQRNKTENPFARLKDWRRIATRCPDRVIKNGNVAASSNQATEHLDGRRCAQSFGHEFQIPDPNLVVSDAVVRHRPN
jgi:transposase